MDLGVDTTQLDASDKPDVADVDRAQLAVRKTSAPLGVDAISFDAVVPLAAWNQMRQHAQVRLDVEVGGVLIGKPALSQDGKTYLFIEAGIPALAAESRETNITFTAEAWTRIHEAIDREHPGAQIVGWYHTHPSFGIFLSEMDLFIQHHFFDLPHQVAIVIDPVAQTHGCFAWRAGVPTLSPLLVEGAHAPMTTPSASSPPARGASKRTESKSDFSLARRSTLRRSAGSILDPLMRLERSQWIALLVLLLISVALFAALTLVWLDISPSTLWQRIESLFNRPTLFRGATQP